MADISREPSSPAEVTTEKIGNEESEEQRVEQNATEYLQGWALIWLTVAFMTVCFVLALDNSILGS